jgi:hypothetical protein
MTPPEAHYENIVCDSHLTDMESVEVWTRHGPVLRERSKGYSCTLKHCTRFFGTEGYSDITEEGEFANIRTEPACSNQHDSQPMYIQRTSVCLRWVCPVCKSVAPFSK